MTRVAFYNCEPLLDGKTAIKYDGTGFEYSNGSGSDIWLALESNDVRHMNEHGFGIDLIDRAYHSGTYDPETVVKIRPHETKKVWDASVTGCKVDNKLCDGTEGRLVVIVSDFNNTMPKFYEIDGYKVCPDVCCIPFEPMEEDCCPDGVVCEEPCVTECTGKDCSKD